MPPWASGPVFTVRRPSLNGAAWAMAGVGNRVSAAAAPAAVPAKSARRETLCELSFRDLGLLDMTVLPPAPRLSRSAFIAAASPAQGFQIIASRYHFAFC